MFRIMILQWLHSEDTKQFLQSTRTLNYYFQMGNSVPCLVFLTFLFFYTVAYFPCLYYPIKWTWAEIHTSTFSHQIQSCRISTHNFCPFAHSHSINCQQLLQSRGFRVSEGFYLWNIKRFYKHHNSKCFKACFILLMRSYNKEMVITIAQKIKCLHKFAI